MNKQVEANNKWRAKYPEKRTELRKRNYGISRKTARNSKHFWSVYDLEAVVRHDVPDRELGKRIGRSVQAIQVMRSKMKTGKIVLK